MSHRPPPNALPPPFGGLRKKRKHFRPAVPSSPILRKFIGPYTPFSLRSPGSVSPPQPTYSIKLIHHMCDTSVDMACRHEEPHLMGCVDA